MKFHPHWKVTVLFVSALGVSTVTHAATISGQGTWETTLQGRDLDGNLFTAEAWYDTTLNITWLANANYAGTAMDWSTANTWAGSLNPYGSGIAGWRLPTVRPIDGTTADDANFSAIGSEDKGYNVSAPGTLYAGSTASEMAYMFYNTLGNKGQCDPSTSTVSTCAIQAGYDLTHNTGPFRFPVGSLASFTFWSDTVYVPYTSYAWEFNFIGAQEPGYKPYPYYAWAVHAGDVGTSGILVPTVPVPAAVWLFGSGLLGLIGVSGKRRR